MEDDYEYVTGTCSFMCPKKEAIMRQKENLLHKFEMKRGTECNKYPEFDPERVVKCYNRSAAGVETTNPLNLRPYPVLLKTIKYLYKEIFPLHAYRPLVVYNFMFDRFRAVRQDAVIQNLPAKEMIAILEPIVRFLIYFGYLLIEEDVSQFDPHINNTHLQECMKRLLVCYDECEEVNQENRWEVESAYVLFNIGNIKPLTRGMRLCEIIDTPKIDIYRNSVELSLQWYLRNYKRVFQMTLKLPILLLCVAMISLPEIRRYTLNALSSAYSSIKSAFPVGHLKNLLLYENDAQVFEECHHYNIRIIDGNVNFLRKGFDESVKCKQGIRLKWVDELLLNCDLKEYLCFGNK